MLLVASGTQYKESGSAFLLIAQDDGIRQLFLDGSRNVQIVHSGNASVIGLGYDPVTRTMFWSTFGNVLKAEVVPNAVTHKLLRDGFIVAEGLAVDWTGRNLYLTDPKMKHIMVCKMDGSSCYSLLSGLGHPRAIQLDMVNRYMYWTDVKDGTIRKAGMDGTNHDVVAMNGVLWPNAMALDLPAGRLYWLDANKDHAFSIKLDGTDQKHSRAKPLPTQHSRATHTRNHWARQGTQGPYFSFQLCDSNSLTHSQRQRPGQYSGRSGTGIS
ncbi:Low-density lipoprotein receptor-related protein 1 [Portunus trituberculatus]|uniref:Low-density lipoprotein receptor-related protein 1 n=1 Tax=Portunus trituberculatus TaxID=210409 RepID=A0A5B7E444_PORTR|nr:Low-density lipoprotein receptor-related protein 1 [Portunus trituberculatus]